jgi:protein associated with RNAse G/E
MDSKSLAGSIVKGTLHTGWYDTISIHVASASLVIGPNQTTLALPSEQYLATVSLVLKTLSESTINIQLKFNLIEMTRTGTLNLVLEATSAL